MQSNVHRSTHSPDVGNSYSQPQPLPLLVTYPLALFGTSLLFDVAYALYGDLSLSSAAFWCIAAGLVGGIVLAALRFWRWIWSVRTPETHAGQVRAWRTLWPQMLGVIALGLFAISWLIRWYALVHEPTTVALILSVLGVAAALGAWLGMEPPARVIRVTRDDTPGGDPVTSTSSVTPITPEPSVGSASPAARRAGRAA